MARWESCAATSANFIVIAVAAVFSSLDRAVHFVGAVDKSAMMDVGSADSIDLG